MFRPTPESTVFRKIPYRLIAAVLVILALVVTMLLLISGERDKLLLEEVDEGTRMPTERLWQSRNNLIVVMLFVFLVSAIGLAAVITLLHHDSTRRTLEEVKGLARNILESIPTGVLTLNRAGVITAVNPMAETVLNRSAAELLGHMYGSVFPEGETIRDALDTALRSHTYWSQRDVPYRTHDGVVRTIRISTAELTGDDSRAAGVILQAQDVTDWLTLERRVLVAEKLAALHTLSAGIAHELRNPLSAMDLNLHLLAEAWKEQGEPAQDVTHYLQVVNAECRRLSAILDTFMRFARPTSREFHDVDLRQLITHIMALMQFEAQERQIQLEERVADSLPTVLGDETQISQVLINLIVNAFHAMREGGRCSLTAEERRHADRRWVEIIVADTGVGITPDALAHLFEPFYTTKAGGTGLGLAIAYRILQDHGGTIRVSSVPGSGTTVIMQFPVAAESLAQHERGRA
jgi:PAS domain S-box-containing protein